MDGGEGEMGLTGLVVRPGPTVGLDEVVQPEVLPGHLLPVSLVCRTHPELTIAV